MTDPAATFSVSSGRGVLRRTLMRVWLEGDELILAKPVPGASDFAGMLEACGT